MNLKNLKNFKEGIINLTPAQMSRGKISGYYGMIVGLGLATYTSFYSKSWGIGIFLFFLCWLQIFSLIGEHKQLRTINQMEQSLFNQPSLEEFNQQLDEAEKEMIE
jgi:hypothetical protein